MAKTTSTPAFPNGGYYGMSLRDWFAGQALSGLMSHEGVVLSFAVNEYAETAYQVADAMLKERGR